MKKIVIVCLFLGAGIGSFAQGKKVKSPVDGRIYSVTLTEEGKKKKEPEKDEISFMAGKFKTNVLVNSGFVQTDYEFEVDSSETPVAIKFTVEAKNDSQERFSWEGTCSGDQLTGTAILRKKGKIEHTYQVSGTWKNKKKPKPQPKPVATPAPAPDSTKTGG